jgi:hypothetical protein
VPGSDSLERGITMEDESTRPNQYEIYREEGKAKIINTVLIKIAKLLGGQSESDIYDLLLYIGITAGRNEEYDELCCTVKGERPVAEATACPSCGKATAGTDYFHVEGPGGIGRVLMCCKATVTLDNELIP